MIHGRISQFGMKQLCLATIVVVALSGLALGQHNQIPSRFNKVIPASPQARRVPQTGTRQPTQTFRERNHASRLHGHHGFGHHHHGRGYGHHHHSRYRLNFLNPYGGFGGYGPYNYGYSFGFTPGLSQYPSGYSSYNVYMPGTLYSEFSTQTVIPSGSALGYSRSAYNADRLEQLLRRQANLVPRASSNIPPGLSISNKTAIPTDVIAKSDQLIAEAAFRERRYPAALEATHRAIGRDQGNGKLWLFSSQIHLALGKYQDAANDMTLAIRILDEAEQFWVVQNFREFYRNADYVSQIEALSQHIEANEKDGAARALRGYHYAGLGYEKQAIDDLKQAVELAPKDEGYQQLLKQLTKDSNEPEVLPPPVPAPVPAGVKAKQTELNRPK